MLPIILIHGFPFDGSMWREQAAFLRSPEGGARAVFTPDLPGFGPGPADPAPAPESASIEFYAAWIHRRIADIGGRAVVGGLSMGGYILFSLLRQFPQDVAAAIFLDTRHDADSPEARENRKKSIEEVQKNGPGAIAEGLLPRLVGTNATPALKQTMLSIMQRQSAAAIIAAQIAMAARRDQTDLLPQIHVPVQIIVGAQDAITPPSVALAMQGHIPQSMLVQIAGAGHLSAMEQPGAVNTALRAFLKSMKPA